ncbi:MAG: hypothetical protein HFI33_07660 [Lachnospiraceae bacterium]|nr:hypothetical protein [Lachnospiraceae bacterium]
MRKYKNTEGRVLEKIICNGCGKEISLHQGFPREGVLEVRQIWGYMSEKDGTQDSFDLCEGCYDKLTAGFQIPPTREEVTELL